MNDAKTLGIGLHVCTSIERDASGNLVGVDCDQGTYEPTSMPVLCVAVVGRPQTVGKREIQFILNNAIVDRIDGGNEYFVQHCFTLDNRFLGHFRIEYIENGCTYWAREFDMGTCPIFAKQPMEVSKLISLLHKFRV